MCQDLDAARFAKSAGAPQEMPLGCIPMDMSRVEKVKTVKEINGYMKDSDQTRESPAMSLKCMSFVNNFKPF